MYTKHQPVSRVTKPRPGAQPLAAVLLRGCHQPARATGGKGNSAALAGPADRPALQPQHWASGWHGPTPRASFTPGTVGTVAGYSLALLSAARFKGW